jgi:malonate transporter and related proteins
VQQIGLVTAPFFGLVLLGWAVARRGMLPLEAIPGLNSFVLLFALPCMLFRFSANTPIAQLLDRSAVTVYLVSALILVALSMLVARRLTMAMNDAAFSALVSAFPNSGFMGVPLLVSLLGPAAAAPAIVALALDMVVTTSLCIALSQLGRSASGRVRPVVLRALRGILSNPLAWSIVLGTLVSATDARLPGPVRLFVDMLAMAASPVALFALGAMLARGQGMACVDDRARDISKVMAMVVLKLLVHPGLVFLVGHLAVRFGMRLDPFAAMVLVLVAALPSASNVAILAERFNADASRLARAVLVSTVGAFISFTSLVSIYQ